MTLGGALGDAARALQIEAESTMTDECAIVDPTPVTGTATRNARTGVTTAPAPTTRYTGKCRVRRPTLAEQNATAGGFTWTLQDSVLALPVATVGVQVGDRVTITASSDPDLVGKPYQVAGVLRGTHVTARRLIIREA